MEKKHGFLSALRGEMARGLSPARSRSRSVSPQRNHSPVVADLLLPKRWKRQKARGFPEELLVPASGILAPLEEGPESGGGDPGKEGWGQWVKDRFHRAPSVSAGACRGTDLRLLLGVLGAPLAPVHVSPANPLLHLSIKDTPIETSSAQYILQQYTAASGGLKMLSSIRNAYAMGKVRMLASEFETATGIVKSRSATKEAESGGFVLWQMAPEMWYVELAVGGSKVHAGCNGKLVWRHTPWLGAHAAKGPVRPLRRALQGLDPLTTASMFADAQCIGEKNVNGEDCFILKLCADPQTLKARSEGPAEIIRHVLFGYFSQKTGLLTHMEDSHLTRIQSSAGGDAVYWETSINSSIHDYRPVEGMMIAHSGRSIVNLFRFGEVAMSHSKTRMEEAWTIDEVAFNVPGLSIDCFIPPADVKRGTVSEACELPQSERARSTMAGSNRSKVAALDKSHDVDDDNSSWRVEV
ncbi:uncharacterized protein LOC122025541 [Zingiber officinale]|uniref:uncharacterized protein LOC122025541 n=1 Tax=Zingiber officinale TaxID=94328 RepID=UPI001C4BCC16|nr:uncharacterized protein LOC122025541 [Zingiber officinale]